MIRTRLYRAGKCIRSDFDPATISDHLDDDGGGVVWLDLREPDDKELAMLAQEFGLNPLAVEDALTERQRPKLDHYRDHVFMSLYSVRLHDDGQLGSSEWAVFAAPRYVITVRKDGHAEIDPVVKRWDDNPQLAGHGVAFLLWGLLDVLVDGHFEAVQTLDDAIEEIEALLFTTENPDRSVQRRSYELRKSLTMLRRVVLPTREVVNALMRRENELVDEAMLPYYQDVYDHVLRVTEWTESLRDLVSTMVETYLSLQGNRLNEIMKKVTSWAAIAAVLAVITGYYGMNVDIVPGAGTVSGGVVAVLLMFVAVVGMYVAFRRRDWL